MNPAKPPMEYPQILQQVTRLLGKHLDMAPVQIKPEDDIASTLKMDSLSAVEFVLSLEDLFKVELPDEVVEGAKTVEDIARRVEEQLLAQGRVADHVAPPPPDSHPTTAPIKAPTVSPQILNETMRVYAHEMERTSFFTGPSSPVRNGLLALVVLALEEHFKIHIPDDHEDLPKLKNVEDLARLVERVLLEQSQVADHTTPTVYFAVNAPEPIDGQTQALIELIRSAAIENHPTVSEQWAKLVLSKYRLVPRLNPR